MEFDTSHKVWFLVVCVLNAKKLALKEGIFAGSSSGAALSAAEKLINEGVKGNIVVILPDRGDRYFSKNLYD